MNEDDKWSCYVCQPEPLQDLVAACEKVLRNLECMKKPKGDPDKPKRDNMKHKQGKVKNSALNGKDANSEGSGTLTFSYKMLKVPKELIKKTKKLIETTNGLNNTFVQFIQQEPVYPGDNIVRHRHLKAFRSVLADLKKVHATLEDALNEELEVQNGQGNRLAGNPNVANAVAVSKNVDPSKEDQVVLDGATDQVPAASEDCVDEEDVIPADVEMTEGEGAVPSPENADDGFIENEANEKVDNGEPDCEDDGSAAGEASLDKDIVSVPPSVPEELFEMVESLSDCVKQEGEKDSLDSSDSTLSKTSLSDRKSAESGKRSAKMSKKLIVKLTPIPLKITIKKDESKSKEKDGALSPDESRRSPRMKTTPLRKTSEGRSKSRSDGTKVNDDSCDTLRIPVSVGLSDSDSDEVPEVLRQVEGMENSSDEQKAESNNEAKTSTVQPSGKTAKRKLVACSGSEDVKSAKKQAAKKKKSKESDSSNHDSDLEKEIRSLSKLSTVKKSSKRAKKEGGESTKEGDESKTERKKGPKRSFARKRRSQRGKENATRDSSSNDEEVEQAADSGEDSSDQQKIKPILEPVMPNMDTFHQSSGQSAQNNQLLFSCSR